MVQENLSKEFCWHMGGHARVSSCSYCCSSCLLKQRGPKRTPKTFQVGYEVSSATVETLAAGKVCPVSLGTVR